MSTLYQRFTLLQNFIWIVEVTFYMDCVILPCLLIYPTVSRMAAAQSLLNLLAVVTLGSISLQAGLLMFRIA